mgnify:CR=1 FL=1
MRQEGTEGTGKAKGGARMARKAMVEWLEMTRMVKNSQLIARVGSLFDMLRTRTI